jgi:aldehyde dehydrogenase (NAD+)
MPETTEAPRVTLPHSLHLIGEETVANGSGGTINHVNPANGTPTPVSLAGAEEVDAAVAAARAAIPAWAGMTPVSRRVILQRLAALLRERSDQLGPLATWENGVPCAHTQFMVGEGPAEWFDYYAGWADKLNGEVIAASEFTFTRQEPYGVVAAIVPWNGPLFEVGMKLAPALAAGNTTVLKPPELAPFTAVVFAQLCLEAGMPSGVVNVVVCGPEGTDALVRHPGVDKISFTGSTPTAKKIMAAAATNLTPVCLELGGVAACLVLADADTDRVAGTVAMMALAMNSGQVCAAPRRVIVEAAVYDEVVDKLAGAAEALALGDPALPDTLVGPVITSESADQIVGHVQQAASAGARIVAGGRRAGGELSIGAYVEPTVIADVDNRSYIAQNEVFGPVVSITRAQDERDAVRLGNDSRYGLAGYLFTQDIGRAHRISAELKAGAIAVNGRGNTMIYTPFGGKKDSGFGREGGRAGIDEFLSVKTVSVEL